MSKTRLRILVSIVLIVVVVVATVVVVLLDRFNQSPTPLGEPSGELAFMSNESGDWDLYLMDEDGTITNLTDNPGDAGDADYFPSWSFDSEMMNFLTNRDGEMGAGQVRPDGSELGTLSVSEAIITTINNGRFDWDPMWSPDGARIAWASLRDFNLEVYITESAAFDDLSRLTSDGFNGPRDWFMTWSPDGTRIAFSSDRTGSEEIYVMDADGSNVMQLTDSEGDDTRPAWSEDGETILFVTERDTPLASGELGLYLMDSDGANQRPIGDEVFTGWLTYSADWSEVVYISNEEGDWNIYIRDADGTNVRRLTESDGDDLFPVWRPTVLVEDADEATEAEATEEATDEADE